MRRALASIVVVMALLTACSFSTSPTPSQPAAAPGQCANGPPMCSPDRRAVIQCQGGAWRLLEQCAAQCEVVANVLRCSAPAAAPSSAPQPTGCTGNGYECAPDCRSLLVCRGGQWALASTCRGARACTSGNAVDCDHSIAAVGDACESASEVACSTDSKQLLRCTSGRYAFGETCPSACLSTSGRVFCQ